MQNAVHHLYLSVFLSLTLNCQLVLLLWYVFVCSVPGLPGQDYYFSSSPMRRVSVFSSLASAAHCSSSYLLLVDEQWWRYRLQRHLVKQRCRTTRHLHKGTTGRKTDFSERYFVIGKQGKLSTEACGAIGALLIHWFEVEDNTLG